MEAVVKHLIPCTSGDEYDALSRWAKVLYWRAGERKCIKRSYRRRERQWLRRQLQREAL